ncbi:Cadherin [Syntrophomonas zehnderi OL-4]|uniref:Cadherin n=1 Tax=Syntrophomonas zehnderi OL-4 TaxID=690567 RepID=A0A0E4G9G5_9FIRM|nr:cadherin-like domain-containing protein [Syntrophomonas zehnderi]CFX14665.1 Cadherin [Syntrophomonas zehnderi OL-4]
MKEAFKKGMSLVLAFALSFGPFPSTVFAAEDSGEIQDSGVPPTLSIGVNGVTDSGATLEFTADQDGTVYYLVQEAAEPEPENANAIRAQSTAVSAATPTDAACEGLQSDTAYVVYGVAESEGLESDMVSQVFTTEKSLPAARGRTTPQALGSGSVLMSGGVALSTDPATGPLITSADTEIEVQIGGNPPPVWLRFIPTESATYTITTTTNPGMGTEGWLYDNLTDAVDDITGDGSLAVASDNVNYEIRPFSITHPLTAGTTYYMWVDSGGDYGTVTLSITGGGLYGGPVVSGALSKTFTEDDPAAAITTAELSATDYFDGTALSYTLTSIPAKGALEKDGTALSAGGAFTQADVDDSKITYTPTANANGADSFGFTVAAPTVGLSSEEETFSISITAVNDEPVLTINTGLTLDEDAPATAITSAMLKAEDVDGDTLTYTIGTEPTKGALKNNATALSSGSTFTQTDIDGDKITYTPTAEVNGADSFSFTVSDGNGGTIGSTAFAITITAVNDAPVISVNTGLSLNEDAPASTITSAILAATDVEGDPLTYTVTSAPAKGTLKKDSATLSAGGTFTPADIDGNKITYTPSADANGADSFAFTVSDSNGGTANGTFHITITEVNDAPTDITLSNSSVSETAAVGSTVGTLSTADVDTGDTFTYSMVSGTGDDDNGGFSIAGNELKTNTTFDYAVKNSYSIRIKSTDNGGVSVEKAFTIHITEVNKAPTNITLSGTSVNENTAAGTMVGTLSTTDPNAADTNFTYTLNNTGDYASFTIDDNRLKLAVSPDYETKSSYAITIRTTDAGGLYFEKSFAIIVVDVNEAPTGITLSGSTVAENASIGAVVGTLAGTDPDAGDTLTFSLPAGSGDNGSFAIDGNSLKLAAVPDYEAKSSYAVTVRATDQGGLTYDKQFTITITDVNEAPTDITLSNNAVSEDAASGSVVGALSTTDADAGDTFTYTLVSGVGDTDNGSFSLSGNELKTATTFSYATQNSYSIRIRATDNGGLFTEKIFTISITETAPSVTGVTSSKANSTYSAGEIIDITLTFSAPVVVTGIPQLTLETGTVDRTANYTSGSGTSMLAFTYTVQPGDTSDDLDYTSTSSLSLNGGTIKTVSGTAAVLTLPTPGAVGSLGANKNIIIDAIMPFVTSVSVPADGTYKAGDPLLLEVSFSKTVSVDITSGEPYLPLAIGSSTQRAVYVSGSGTATLTFKYIVQSGDFDADGIAIASAISLDGGMIRDLVGNNAELTLSSVGATGNILIDAVAPTVTISMGKTTLTAGESCQVTFAFSEPVTGFANDDLTISNGSLTPVTSADGGITYTATFTADSVNAAANTIILDLAGIADSAGNTGVGTASSTNYSIRIITAPGAPTDVTATAGDRQAAIRFTPPASDGGAAILSYTITANPGGITATGAASPITVTGLTNGVAYTFTVTATNSVGTGAESTASNSVTPQVPWSGGGNDDGDSSGPSVPVATVPDKKPDQPVTASASITAAAGADGTAASANIPDKAITDAIARAQADARAQGNTSNGFAVELNVTMLQGAASLTTTLSQSALNSLVSAGVTSLTINGSPVKVTFDLKALQEIQKQSSGNVSITIAPQAKLSASAKAMIGTRPVYDLTVGYGSGKTVSGFGGGTATVSVPYTPAKGEAVGALYAVYVDEKGNATRIEGSAYDANSRSIIFTTTHFSAYGVGYTAPSAKFTDISTHWAKESIDYVVGRGLLSGTSKTTFAPNTAMTRGMLVTALGRLAGVDVKAYTTTSFTDVKADSAFGPYIEWAYKKGIVQGIGNSRFAPDRAITREEIAVIFANFAKAAGYKLPIAREASTYADDSSIGSTYKTAVTAMQQAGIMMGETNNKFNPKANATRAEVSSMLHRYIKLTIDPATAQGWALNDDGQYMYYKDGKALTGTQTIDGMKYFFNTDGTLKTGWMKDGDNWRYYIGNKAAVGWLDISDKRYYFTKDGIMVSGKWLQIDGKWYYFYTDGALARNTKVDGYEVDENGVRKTK